MANAANPALQNLAILVGEWEVELSFPTDPPGRVVGHASCAWLTDGAFIRLENTGDSQKAICIIGRDDSAEPYTMLYFDHRGVSRVYLMSLEGGEWKQWREAPGFSQRFVGAFSDDGNSITARWEKSSDGAHWEHDFDLRYTRVG